jgi:hypothetical protein
MLGPARVRLGPSEPQPDSRNLRDPALPTVARVEGLRVMRPGYAFVEVHPTKPSCSLTEIQFRCDECIFLTLKIHNCDLKRYRSLSSPAFVARGSVTCGLVEEVTETYRGFDVQFLTEHSNQVCIMPLRLISVALTQMSNDHQPVSTLS